MRCDPASVLAERPQGSFNPHTYMRCDVAFFACFFTGGVSIHTPTWGVTSNSMYCVIPPMFQSTHLHEVWHRSVGRYVQRLASFNPHTYMRCDNYFLHSSRLLLKFQSTHLHEVWHLQQKVYNMLNSFNPHTYMRCDSIPILLAVSLACFNPHTYMRCDHKERHKSQSTHVSIHTPTWGVTPGHCRVKCDLSFNPHTYMRCDSFRFTKTSCP